MDIFSKLIKALFERRSAVGFMGETFIGMLDDALRMFMHLEEVFHETKNVSIDIDTFYKTDQRINRAEQEIRSKIVQHFVLNPGQDTVECLVLMSLVKDAERLGDYCKNILELRRDSNFPSLAESHEEITGDLDGIRDIILKMFSETRAVYISQSEEKARSVLDLYAESKTRCDALIAKAVAGDEYGLTPGQAVVAALHARFLRRIASHLENINSSVIVPVHRLDFQPAKDDKGTESDD